MWRDLGRHEQAFAETLRFLEERAEEGFELFDFRIEDEGKN